MKRRSSTRGRLAVVAAALTIACSSSDAPQLARPSPLEDASTEASLPPMRGDAAVVGHVPLPAGAPGVGFDDLQFAPGLGKILAPAGRSGNLDLVDVETEEVIAISGFSTSDQYMGGHDFGTTSAVEGRPGTILATDRTTDQLHVVDVQTKTIVASLATAAHPDYVRFVASKGEAWLTEPDVGQIEVISVSSDSPPVLAHVAIIAIAGGPESLVVDATRSRAYTSSFLGTTYAVDLDSRAIVETWSNGCKISLGLALDESRGLAFVGCPEGKAVVLDVAHGGVTLATTTVGGGVDIVAFSPWTGHLYVPSPNDKTLAIFGVASDGVVTELGVVEGAGSSVAPDDRRQAWVTDPVNGSLIRIRDVY